MVWSRSRPESWQWVTPYPPPLVLSTRNCISVTLFCSPQGESYREPCLPTVRSQLVVHGVRDRRNVQICLFHFFGFQRSLLFELRGPTFVPGVIGLTQPLHPCALYISQKMTTTHHIWWRSLSCLTQSLAWNLMLSRLRRFRHVLPGIYAVAWKYYCLYHLSVTIFPLSMCNKLLIAFL